MKINSIIKVEKKELKETLNWLENVEIEMNNRVKNNYGTASGDFATYQRAALSHAIKIIKAVESKEIGLDVGEIKEIIAHERFGCASYSLLSRGDKLNADLFVQALKAQEKSIIVEVKDD